MLKNDETSARIEKSNELINKKKTKDLREIKERRSLRKKP